MTAALAVMRMRWLGHRRDIWARVTSTEVAWSVHDIAAALGDVETAQAVGDRHDEAMRTWTVDAATPYIRDHIERLPLAVELLQWLEDQTAGLMAVGLGEHVRLASQHPPILKPSGHPLPEYFSVHEAAEILDRDPAIETGEHRLFHAMLLAGWIRRQGSDYYPEQYSLERRFLEVQRRRVPGRDEPYPQIVLTADGIRALHVRLGGQAAPQFVPHSPTPLSEVPAR